MMWSPPKCSGGTIVGVLHQRQEREAGLLGQVVPVVALRPRAGWSSASTITTAPMLFSVQQAAASNLRGRSGARRPSEPGEVVTSTWSNVSAARRG